MSDTLFERADLAIAESLKLRRERTELDLQRDVVRAELRWSVAQSHSQRVEWEARKREK